MNMSLQYESVIETNGIKVPFVPHIITPAIASPMRRNRYEGAEIKALREILKFGDRVLELGAGVGVLSTVAAACDGVEDVVTIEANPEMIPLIRETHSLNRSKNVTVLNGVVSSRTAEVSDFYLRENFWSSSMEPDSRPYLKAVKVPTYSISDLITRYKPTVLVCDIEGGELGLFDGVDLSTIRAIIIEFHPRVYGHEYVDTLISIFEQSGLYAVPIAKPDSVRQFTRYEVSQVEEQWPPVDPTFFVSTCMKDEGPFIIEWIAWHKSIGINSFVVFTNDCTDGTDLILDRLEELGYLRHLPNPAILSGSTYFQPLALSYTQHLPEWRKADFYISMDVDEFINVRVGDGTMSDLIVATGFFDALSMSELNHGSNDNIDFMPGLVTELFPLHQTERPGFRKSSRGVKTITRISKKLEKPRNHRPDFKTDQASPVWKDGSGRLVETLIADASLNGIDVRGTYDLVSLDHFALRSLDSYLIKMFRGDVVVSSNRVSQRYWRIRNQNENKTSNFERQQIAFRCELKKLMADSILLERHQKACDVHSNRAAELNKIPEFSARREWILENSWEV